MDELAIAQEGNTHKNSNEPERIEESKKYVADTIYIDDLTIEPVTQENIASENRATKYEKNETVGYNAMFSCRFHQLRL
jgi:hypothetical protein